MLMWILIGLGVVWLIPGIICLYYVDFTEDTFDGFKGVLVMVGTTLVLFVIGPLFIRTVLYHRRGR